MKTATIALQALLLVASLALATPVRADAVPGVEWLRDEHVAFERARAERRYVLLYLEAVWCHWCHVMDHDTYGDATIRTAIAAHYVPLRIDQDARPDLANRYREYGWPATIVFAPDGSEIVKRRGFIAPAPFARLLAAIVAHGHACPSAASGRSLDPASHDTGASMHVAGCAGAADPSPEHAARLAEPAPPVRSSLPDDIRAELLRRHRDTFDRARGGLATAQKYVDRDSVEHALALAGDPEERTIAVKTLDAARALIDPVWGGVYQYSTNGDWEHPHFEKLGTLQGEYLRVYARAYATLGEKRYLDAANAVRRYIDAFLAAPEGGYYASQDADPKPGQHGEEYFALDDAARRAVGMPRIDRHRYAREAGAIAEGLAVLYEAGGDVSALDAARRAIRWALEQRAIGQGGFRHGAQDDRPYLADNLAMGRALLQLYRVTGERVWLGQATATAKFIARTFRAPAGYAGGAPGDLPIAPVPQIDENIQLARFANLLAHYTGRSEHRDIARHAFSYLAQPSVALARLSDIGIVTADSELNSDPLHLTVVGAKDDAASAALFAACLRVPAAYKRLDWWDRAEGPLPNPDVNYPQLKRPAAFVCTEQRCSTPIFDPADVAKFL